MVPVLKQTTVAHPQQEEITHPQTSLIIRAFHDTLSNKNLEISGETRLISSHDFFGLFRMTSCTHSDFVKTSNVILLFSSHSVSSHVGICVPRITSRNGMASDSHIGFFPSDVSEHNLVSFSSHVVSSAIGFFHLTSRNILSSE